LLNRLHPLNVANVAQENTKSTEPLVLIVQKEPLLSLDPQARLHVPYVQQELLLFGLGLLLAANAKQELMKSTEPLVLIVQKEPLLSLDPQVKLHVPYAQQELLLFGLGLLLAANVKQELMKSTEPLVLIVQKEPLLLLDPQARLHVPYVQQELLLFGQGLLLAANAKQELTKSTEPLVLIVQKEPLLSLDLQARLHVPYVQQELLLFGLGLLLAANVKQELMKSTEPLVLIVQKEPLLLLDAQAKLRVPYAQQELLLVGLGLLLAANAKQELMKSTELLVLLVHKEPTLARPEQQDVFLVMQDITLPRVDLLSVSVVMQDLMKSIEAVV